MKFQKRAAILAFLGAVVLASGAFAEDTAGRSWPRWPQWLQIDSKPSQEGSMCGAGGTGQCGASQSSAAQQSGCPMMRKTADLEKRVRDLEQRLKDILDTAQPGNSDPAKSSQ